MVSKRGTKIKKSEDVIIGTANFGNRYGIQNDARSFEKNDIIDLFRIIKPKDLLKLDTAPGYGRAEQLIGECLGIAKLDARITTKIPQKFYSDVNSILDSIRNSLKLLGVKQLESVMLHGVTEDFLTCISSLEFALNSALEQGLTKKIGISCYQESDIEISKSKLPGLSVFQVPENILDQRLIKSAIVADLYKSGDEFIVRSIFLQGLLLLDSDSLPHKFGDLRMKLKLISEITEKLGITRLEYCLNYIRNVPWSSGFVIGIQSIDNLLAVQEILMKDSLDIDYSGIALDNTLIDPRTWR